MTRRFRLTPRQLGLASALLAASALATPGIASAQLGDKTLKKGDSGADVKQLQKALRAAGYSTPIDGQYGNDTVKRVRAFEGNEQLKVDGKVTPSDAQKLAATSERGKGGEVPALSGGASPDSGTSGTDSGSDTPAQPTETTPGAKATVNEDGLAVAPASAPAAVKKAIAAGNEIATTPYVYGGGHGKLKASGYDCSGSISYALRKAGIFKAAMASGPMMKFGESGKGQWITLYANAGHAYMVIAGIRFDTSARKQDGTRWTTESRSSSGYTARHPDGF